MPMDRSLYPPNWEEISAALKEQVGQVCEQCGIPNEIYIYRNKFNPAKWIREPEEWEDSEESEALEHELYYHRTEYPRKPHQVVLTTAHLDHNPANNERSNLRVLCQRCHLLYDLPHHIESRKANRAAKERAIASEAGQLTLEEWI